jgi:hypothetical protein
MHEKAYSQKEAVAYPFGKLRSVDNPPVLENHCDPTHALMSS